MVVRRGVCAVFDCRRDIGSDLLRDLYCLLSEEPCFQSVGAVCDSFRFVSLQRDYEQIYTIDDCIRFICTKSYYDFI